ncbi:MAG: four helix bundle protein [Candidatus Nomurabacteria bacterium]|jgi:hypothetical protein|nr:four helix bundle protein [Candidatus Nomurabacteria bacterium]
MTDLPVIMRTQELYIAVGRVTEKLPALKRQTLGRRLEDALLAMLEYEIMAKNAPKAHKVAYLIKAGALAELAMFQLRIMMVEKLAHETTLHQLSAGLLEISKMMGGWRKSVQ